MVVNEVDDKHTFNNGYGAIIINKTASYGGRLDLFELTVIKLNGDEWEDCFTTTIGVSPIGWLMFHQTQDLLKEIEAF